MTTYPVTLEPTERYRLEGVCEGFYTSETVVRMATHHGGTVRMKVCYTAPDGLSRRVFQGPIEPGPFAEFTPLPTVIDMRGGTGAERQRLQAAGLEHDVVDGDVLVIDGVEYRIVDSRRGSRYPALVPVV